MTLLALELDQLRNALPEGANDAQAQINALNNSVAGLGKDLQAISHRLHSSKLEYLGIATAAGSFCKELASQRGVKIDYVQRFFGTAAGDQDLLIVCDPKAANIVAHQRERHTKQQQHDDDRDRPLGAELLNRVGLVQQPQTNVCQQPDWYAQHI